MNKGYAFFEYIDDRAAEKAIKALNQLEIKDKRLKVQKASEGLQKSAVISAHRAVPEEK
jgi:RNA recognition motif-containing protein